MNSRLLIGIVIAIVGVVLVVAGIFMAMRLLDVNVSAPEPQPTPVLETTVQIAFAAGDIMAGAVLTEADVVLREIPIQYLPRDTIEALDEAVGKITKVDLYQGQMILEHNLANPTASVFDVAYIISETNVLMALPATDLMSRESIIQRGDIIDILVSYTETIERAGDAEEDREPIRQQVTFNAKQRLDITAIVMDIIRRDDEQASGIPTRNQITVRAYLVALDPQDALVLKYLIDIGGVLDYVIRAPTSTGQFDLTPVTSQFIKELYGLQLLP